MRTDWIIREIPFDPCHPCAIRLLTNIQNLKPLDIFFLESEILNNLNQHYLIMKVLNYRILLRKEPEGGYTVTVPSLSGCITYGDTIEEAIDMAKEAIELYIESLKEHGEVIPTEESTFEYTIAIEAYA
jgi:predicted RNase H-like HicB family nuclease